MTRSFSLIVREAWREFRSAERGNVMMTFALAVVPIMGLVGAAVDYSRAGMIRANMQAAVDATALAVSKSAASQTTEQIQTAADTYFRSVFSRADASNVQVTSNYTNTNGSELTVSAKATIKADVMGVMGYSQLPIGASSTTKWGNVRLRVSLVLDNTGSMLDSNKIGALKTASHNLLTQLKNAAVNNGDVYVSIIPFTTGVTVDGATNYGSSWVKWSGSSDTWDEKKGTCSKSYSTKSSCLNNGGTWTPTDHSTWNGCLMDRDQDHDAKNTEPTVGTPTTLFPANTLPSQYKCPVQLMPLSYDWVKLNQKIDDMVAAGGTNQTVGLAWGWQSLSQVSPLNAPAMDPNYQYQQVVILLTDGLNTKNRWDGNGSDPSNAVDLRTKAACQNIKAANITIYTVLVMAGNSSILQECASSPSKYYKLTSADQMITTFNQIGTELAQLRVAK